MQDELNKICPKVAGQPFILFLSRIHEKKGIVHLIEAYSNLFALGGKDGVSELGNSTIPKLLIAGPGLDSMYGKKLQTLVTSKNLTNHVFFPGMLTGNAKWGSFYGCDAFILPSHQENFGIAVVEALACAKPVLISNQINIWREIIEAGGGLVEDDTKQGTQNLLLKWLQLTNESKIEMGERATESFRKSFSIETSSKRFFEMLIS
jgi:glycosyltransferase involved in cell wall biosynthesis